MVKGTSENKIKTPVLSSDTSWTYQYYTCTEVHKALAVTQKHKHYLYP